MKRIRRRRRSRSPRRSSRPPRPGPPSHKSRVKPPHRRGRSRRPCRTNREGAFRPTADGDRLRIGRRHRDVPPTARRPAACLPPGDERDAHCIPPTAIKSLHIHDTPVNGELYVLRTSARATPGARPSTDGADQLARGAPEGAWITLLDPARHRRDERHLPRLRAGRHADAGERRPLHQRVLLRPLARRLGARLLGARHLVGPVVAQGQQPHRRVGNLGAPERRRAGRARLLRADHAARRGRCCPWLRTPRSSTLRPGARRTSVGQRRAAAKQGTTSAPGRVLWRPLARPGRLIVFKRDFRVEARHRFGAASNFIRGAAPPPARRSSTFGSQTTSTSSPSRPTARRSPSSSAARSSPPPARTAATPRASPRRRRRSRSSPGRPTADASPTSPTATAPHTSTPTTSRPTRRRN